MARLLHGPTPPRMKICHLDLDPPTANPAHDALTLPPIEYEAARAFEHPVMRSLTFGVLAVLTGLVVYLMHRTLIGEHDRLHDQAPERQKVVDAGGRANQLHQCF